MEELTQVVESLHRVRVTLNEIRNSEGVPKLTKTAIGHQIEEIGLCEQTLQEVNNKLRMILTK